MPSQHESPALRVARAHVAAWSAKDWDTARSLLAPDVHVTAVHTGPYPPPTDLTGADDYMKGLTAFAEPIVAGSVRELAGVGDDRSALLTLDLQEAFDPAGPAVPAPCARLYLVEDGKIKTEQIVLYVAQG
jgi:ketosteroid isomerase-like protein